MNTPTSPAADPWRQVDPYEHYMGRWSRRLAPLFLQALGLPPGLRWLDLGCGTGALSAAIRERARPQSLTAVDPSAAFVEQARLGMAAEVDCRVGAADALPLPDDAVDVCVSSLVLNFVPDLGAGLREMQRVTASGGCIAACVWDYAGRMDLIRWFWDAAIACDPSAAEKDEGRRFPLCEPRALAGAFADAGLTAVDTGDLWLATPFVDFDDLWQPFLGGQGPAPGYVASLAVDRREALRERLRARHAAAQEPMQARAWTVRGRVA